MFGNILWNREAYNPEVWETQAEEDYSDEGSNEIELFERLFTRISGGRVRHSEVED